MVRMKGRASQTKPPKSAPVAKPRARRRNYRHAPIKQPTWQNPIIEYWGAKKHKPRLYRRPPKRIRLERQILGMLALFSISIGLWENFRQLWLQENGFGITDVSNIISLGMVVSVVGVLLVGRFVKMAKIKVFVTTTLAVRSANLLLLAFLNGSGLTPLIGICAVIDVLTGILVLTSVYPLLTTVMKSNTVYSHRKLVEYIFRDIGILVGALVVGQQIGSLLVDYNICLLIAMLLSIAAAVVMWRLHLQISERAPKSKFSALKFVLKSHLHRTYMIYVFLAGTAFTTVVGLKMLILTDIFDLSAGAATTYLLIIGLLADVVGVLALKFFTPKNDYVTLMLKFGTRILIFLAAFLSGSTFVCFLALTWTLLSSTAYENITDGYYINSVDNRHQLKYNALKNVVTYSGDATGMFLCGQMFELGAKYIFGLAAVLIIAQIAVAFYLIYIRRVKKAR